MELLCIQTHSQKIVLAGQIYQLIRISKSLCYCKDKLVDVGIRTSLTIKHCPRCGGLYQGDETCWLKAFLFIPIGTQDELENYKLSEPALK